MAAAVAVRGAPVEVEGLSKVYRGAHAVDDLTFAVRPGAITGFLGPNGAGKTTTLKLLLGLAVPTAGRALVFGRPYRELDDPGRRVGAVLEVSGFHPGRSGRDHLRVLATMARLPRSRVEEVLRLVELEGAAGRRAGGYSLGMRQRLALAAALLGDPELLVLDEPANGLDPPGIRWLRDVLRAEAAAGRTVLVSSHMLAEVAQTVDDVVVIARGRRVYEGSISGLTQGGGGLVVEGEEPARLALALERAGATVQREGADRLVVHGMRGRAVSAVAREEGLLLDVLAPRSASLEDVFLELTDRPRPAEVGP